MTGFQPFSQDEARALLRVQAELPAVRIEVLDGRLNLVLKGYGEVEGELPPGGYRVRWRAGDGSEETTVLLQPREHLTLREPSGLAFPSAAPIEGTGTSHEYQQGAAQETGRERPLELGRGAELVLHVRGLDPIGKIHPRSDLSLHDGAGGIWSACRRWRNGAVAPSGGVAGSAGRRIALDAGLYRPRVAISERTAREMTVAACPGWQTQVFLLRQGGTFGRRDGRRLPDLDGAAVLMVPAGDRFRPWERVSRGWRTPEEAGFDLRLAELARKALARGCAGSRVATFGPC